MPLQLRQPCLELASSFEAMREDCLRVGIDEWTGHNSLAHHDIPAFIETLVKRAQGKELPENWVPETTYWVVENGTVVGELQLRPRVSGTRYEQYGGNIGYFVHPAHRRKGVAIFALREALKILAKEGINEALVTCRDDNVGSIRVIEDCGGAALTIPLWKARRGVGIGSASRPGKCRGSASPLNLTTACRIRVVRESQEANHSR